MKRNLIIVLVLVLIGGGFMFINSNTDFFKGALTINRYSESLEENQSQDNLDDVSNNLPFDGKHFIDLYYQSRINEHNDCTLSSDLSLSEDKRKCDEIRNDALNRKEALESLYNLDYFNEFRAKKVDGKWVACDDGDYSNQCKSLSDLGYEKEFFHELFGLDPYNRSGFSSAASVPQGKVLTEDSVRLQVLQ